MLRSFALGLVVFGLIASSCGKGAEATPVGTLDLVCTDAFCVEYPDAWDVVDQGGAHVSFTHPGDPDALLATVGSVNMEGLVVANGGTWPQTPSGVVDVFWAAADNGKAELATKTVLGDGSVESFGAFGSGRMWTRLIPIDTSRAIGVEMRAPNSSWQTHADVFLGSVTLLP